MSAITNPLPALSAQRLRTWPAILALLFLPGITAEMLTGSTPVITYLTNPLRFIANTLLYGAGALLIRETVRRRKLGWMSIFLLGAAYGIFEEGLFVNTWANPWQTAVCTVSKNGATGLCNYSRIGGINVSWALELTIFHAIISIAVPILLVELVFPRHAHIPWLGRKAPWALVVIELILLAAGLVLNVSMYRDHRLAGPPVGPYLFEVALMIAFIILALTRKPRITTSQDRPLPRLWTVRLFTGIMLFLSTILPTLAKGSNIPFQIELIIGVLILLLGIWRVATWVHRSGWNERYMLALATGAVGYLLVIWDPLLEVIGSAGDSSTRGTVLVALLYGIALIILARKVAQRMQTESQQFEIGKMP